MTEKTETYQLSFDLPDDTHPATIERRARREITKNDNDEARRAAMVRRHREEWEDHLDIYNDAIFKRSETLARIAKILAETLRIRQAEERAAWLDLNIAPTMDPETRRRRIAELAKEIGLGVVGN